MSGTTKIKGMGAMPHAGGGAYLAKPFHTAVIATESSRHLAQWLGTQGGEHGRTNKRIQSKDGERSATATGGAPTRVTSQRSFGSMSR